MSWFAGLAIPQKIAAGILGALFLGAAILVALNLMQRNAKNAGKNEVTVQVQNEVLRHVEEAKNAKEALPNRTDQQRRADCLRRSRTPENCQ